MAKDRGARWVPIALGALCVLLLLTAFLPPIAVRALLLHRLATQGIRARIGSLDVNVFTGHISLDQLRATGPHGAQLHIGHLALNIAYAPLFRHRIDITRLGLSGAILPLARGAQGHWRVLGLKVPLNSTPGGPGGWGVAVDHAQLAGTTIGWPATASGPHALTLEQVEIGRYASWQAAASTPVRLQATLGKGGLRLRGQLSPGGAQASARLQLHAHDLPLAPAAPLLHSLGWQTLGGRLSMDQTLQFDRHPGAGWQLTLAGQVDWQQPQATTAGTRLQAKDLGWQGRLQLQAKGATAPLAHARGKLRLSGVDVARSGQLHFTQNSAQWQGKAQIRFGHTTSRLTSQGTLGTTQTRLDAPGWLSLATPSASLDGGLDLSLTATQTIVATRGKVRARTLAFAMPQVIAFNSSRLDWQGRTRTTLGGQATRIHTNGQLASDGLSLKVPQTFNFTAAHADWQGESNMHSARLFSRQAKGQFAAAKARLTLPGMPVRVQASHFGFDGQYAEMPDSGGQALRLTVSGAAHSQHLQVVNTTIGAPWATVLQGQASGIAIAGLNHIKIQQFDAAGLHLLGSDQKQKPLLQAVTLHASRFALVDLAHYRLHTLTIHGANIHARRTGHGMGALSRFFGGHHGGGQTHQAKGQATTAKAGTSTASGQAGPATTFAVDRLTLKGPSLHFVDTTTRPKVRINGANLSLTVSGLNTARPAQGAKYDLGLDVGAYGHLDSRGTIAPFAPGGPNIDLNAWLRSLALAPLSGYLDAAMHRKIANGAADGTLDLKATHGQLNGLLNTTIANFRLANSATRHTEIAFGISMNTALKLLRGRNDLIHFQTKILGDVTNPYFSINNLIREAVLAGLRTALMSDYSPLGLINKLKNAFADLFQSVKNRPAVFAPGKHYVRPADRKYLALLAQAMTEHPDWALQLSGQAVPADARAMHLAGAPAGKRRQQLLQLARAREGAVRDYLAARNVNPARIHLAAPRVTSHSGARPAVHMALHKKTR